MQRFTEGDPVRIDIPDSDHPDHEAFHGREGVVTEKNEVYSSIAPSWERENILYSVRFADGTELDFGPKYVRPP